MQKTVHLFEEQIYHLSNHSVALNPMFADKSMQGYFLSKMEKYLTPVCSVLASCLNDNEFQLVVRLKTRKVLETYYVKKNSKKYASDGVIPESTYIFSQAMSNLQVSFVKHFNYTYKRSGTLMASRFSRKLIETEEELMDWKELLNHGIKKHSYSQYWSNRLLKAKRACTSKWLYEGSFEDNIKTSNLYLRIDHPDLVINWKKTKKYRLDSTLSFYQMKLNLLFYKNGLPLG